jgi:hypothetical protein
LFVSVCGFAVMTSKPTLEDSVARSATAADRKPVILSASEASAFSPFEQPKSDSSSQRSLEHFDFGYLHCSLGNVEVFSNVSVKIR